MPKRSSARVGSELFIVDNSEDDWKALRYLKDWCELSKSIDIASGFFEVGALLALDGEWQKLDKIRILMGDGVSRRTKRAFESALTAASSVLDGSLEGEKQKNHFLRGVGAFVHAVGTVVTCSVIGTGVILSVAGEALAFVPNALGRALLHNERL